MACKKTRHKMTESEYGLLSFRYYAMLKTTISVEFDSLDDFLKWAKGKYAYGMTLERIDINGPFSPDNCRFVEKHKSLHAREHMQKSAEAWEKFAAPIRERYAKQIEEIQRRGTTVFRYEHPDLVREGIVFEGSRSM